MKKMLVSVGILALSFSAKSQVVSFDAGLKGAYNGTAMFNKDISDLGEIQDYKMATGSNVGVALNANVSKIGLTIEFLSGQFNAGYQGKIGSTTYTSNVNLKTFSVPILLKLGGQTGGYAEIGISTNSIKSAEYSNSLSTATSDVSGKYTNYKTAVLGFGSKVSLSKNFPLILNVGIRLQYGFTDARGVDGQGNSVEGYRTIEQINTNTFNKSNAASAGINVGLTYRIK